MSVLCPIVALDLENLVLSPVALFLEEHRNKWDF